MTTTPTNLEEERKGFAIASTLATTYIIYAPYQNTNTTTTIINITLAITTILIAHTTFNKLANHIITEKTLKQSNEFYGGGTK